MELQSLQNKLNQKKRGQFLTITYQKVIGAYKKVTTAVVRLVDYNNVKAVKEKKALKYGNTQKQTITGEKKPSADKYLGNNIIFNENTGKTRLQVFVTKNHKPHSIYTYEDNTIDKETYYLNSGDKENNADIMYSVNIENILMIK